MGNWMTKVRSISLRIIFGLTLFFSIILFHGSPSLASCYFSGYGFHCGSLLECSDKLESYYQDTPCGYYCAYGTTHMQCFIYVQTRASDYSLICTNTIAAVGSCIYPDNCVGPCCNNPGGSWIQDGILHCCPGNKNPCCGKRFDDECCKKPDDTCCISNSGTGSGGAGDNAAGGDSTK